MTRKKKQCPQDEGLSIDSNVGPAAEPEVVEDSPVPDLHLATPESVPAMVDDGAPAAFPEEPMESGAVESVEVASPQVGTEPESAATDNGVSEEPSAIHPLRVIEAILFATDSPLPPARVAQVLGVGNARDVRKHIAELNRQYAEWGVAFRVEEIAGGYQMLTLPLYNSWLTKLLRARQETRLSQAAMETLAIVAYKQPCTRAEVEVVRGVAAGDLLNRLREMNLVKIVGRAEDLGRPLLYGTTKRFLEVFGLGSLEDLPKVEALSSGAKAAPGVKAAPAETLAEEPAAGDGAPSLNTVSPSAEVEAPPPSDGEIVNHDTDNKSAE